MQTNPLLPDADKPAENDHLLEELAALTGLFSPTVLWHTEEKLDDLDDQAAREEAKLQKPAQHPEPPISL